MNAMPEPAYTKYYPDRFNKQSKAGDIFSSRNGNNSLPFFLYPNFEQFARYNEPKLDLNEELSANTDDTFLIRVSGDSMINAGIDTGDILVVDRSLLPDNNKVVIAEINNKLLVKRIKYNNGDTFLVSENIYYPEIHIKKNDDFQIWGVVTSVIKNI